MSEKVDDILKEALDVIEDKQDYLHFAEDIDLFSLIEDGLSKTDSCQGTVINGCFPSEFEATYNIGNATSLDQDDNISFYCDENESFQKDSQDCMKKSQICSPGFSDPLLSSAVPPLAAREKVKGSQTLI